MNTPEILLITEDAIEATKISRWLDSWEYAVKIMGFGNKLISSDNLIKYDLIIVDIPFKYKYDGIKVFDNIKNILDVPVMFIASPGDDYKIDFPKTFYYIP